MQLLNHIVYCRELIALDMLYCIIVIAITQLNVRFIVFKHILCCLKELQNLCRKIIKIKTTTVQRPTFKEFYFSFLLYVENKILLVIFMN